VRGRPRLAVDVDESLTLFGCESPERESCGPRA
jgi:hypothetical protein